MNGHTKGREVRMVLQGRITDRQILVKALEDITNKKAVYHGYPGFLYSVGQFTVLRNGNLECRDAPDEKTMRSLEEAGLIETETNEHTGFEYEIVSARMLVNVINTFSSRGEMINKAIGKPRAFHISARLQNLIEKWNPETVMEVLECITSAGGEKSIRGMKITSRIIRVTGFPEDDEEEAAAYRQFMDVIIEAASNKTWIKPKAVEAENEKYSFRIWMNSIGMIGKEYAATRTILLSRLDGNTTFRLPSQREAFYAKKQKTISEEEFILL